MPITKKEFAIKLLFWLLPWPLSMALPKSLRIYYFGVDGNIYDGWWDYYGDQIHITQDIIDTFDFFKSDSMRKKRYLDQDIIDTFDFFKSDSMRKKGDLNQDIIDTFDFFKSDSMRKKRYLDQDIIDTFYFFKSDAMRKKGDLNQRIINFLILDLFDDLIDTEKYVFLDFFLEFQRGKRNEFRSISAWDQHFDSNDFECHDYEF